MANKFKKYNVKIININLFFLMLINIILNNVLNLKRININRTLKYKIKLKKTNFDNINL